MSLNVRSGCTIEAGGAGSGNRCTTRGEDICLDNGEGERLKVIALGEEKGGS
jgi:hypothetical protein